MRSRRILALSAPAALLTAVLLAGCVPTAGPEPEPSNGTPSASATASPSPTPSASPTEEIIPFSIDCAVLIPGNVMYSFDPNFALLGAIEASAGSIGAEAAAAGGMTCRWVHETSGITLDVSVAQLTPAAATARKNDLVQSSNSVPTYGVEAYFQVVGDAGEAQAFPDPYWVSMVSPALFEPGDATPLMSAAFDALR